MGKKVSKKTLKLNKKTTKSSNSSCSSGCCCDKCKLNPFSLAYTLAIISSAGMIILSIAGKLGYFLSTIEMMKLWHFSYSLTFMGIIGGTAEAGLFGLVIGFLFGKLYNQFV
jgi:hypothetical protein